MANSLGTLTSNLISSIMLESTLARLAPLRAITTDFSGEALDYGQAIKVRAAVPASVADYSTTNGYVAAADVTTTDYTVTVNKHKHVSLSFNEQELSGTKRNLLEEQVRASAYNLADAIIDDVLALIVPATFTNTALVAADTAFNRDALIELRKSLNVAGAPDMNRSVLVNPGAFAYLTKDSKIISRDYADSDNIDMGSGTLLNVAGFRGVYEVPGLPSPVVGGGTMNACALHPSALLMATRLPKDPGAVAGNGLPIPGSIETITDPATGFSLQSRTWYDMQKGFLNQTWTVMYGVAAGVIKHLSINKTAV